VFNALAGRDHQLEGLISNGERTFSAAAEQSQAFAAAFRALPGFESSSTIALRQLDTFANAANPYYEQFRAVEKQLTPTVQALIPFAPAFEHQVVALGKWTKASEQGLPAFEHVLALTTPVLKELTPELRNFNPFLRYLGEYEPELQSFFANATAASQAVNGNENTTFPGKLEEGPRQHYLRGMNVLGPESLAVYSTPVGTNRANAYFQPGAFASLLSGLPVFGAAFCANSAPAANGPANEFVSEAVIKQLRGESVKLVIEGELGKQEKVFPPLTPVVNKPGGPNEVGAPACRQQGPFTVEGRTSQFPQVTPER
jgi:phospholipid/cholesterol/gamma-HCH transport system substrate-binding protein